MTGLRATSLSVSYGDLVALQPVDLDVPAGRFVAVTGPSGAGKTSLLWALAGALRPTQGEVRVDDVVIGDREQAAALGVVLVPQGNGLATALTAYENALVPLLAVGVRPAAARKRADDALAVVGLEESGGHLVEELSGGQQQRVALARAFAAHAHVLLADEPTSDLDATNRERMIAVMRAEADRGAVVVMSTHDPEAAARADAELALDQGVARWVPKERQRDGSHRAGPTHC
ncbi:ATP-binding cassette domain-containing protein [Nocardioides mangrovicus]|uniref:ATP-binding cassette domain-containing protein n=1 Tax=Nocardioides mangrovicus TaxID=2478913 RepID=A0A3L8P446_9ACTN|nr:ATP-binding cassette domain-containing protein [Nocardioides mangrovicus]RLV49319.1 ATP-binding cassette domain-containing protein [Nocardioides mangrovicus]